MQNQRRIKLFLVLVTVIIAGLFVMQKFSFLPTQQTESPTKQELQLYSQAYGYKLWDDLKKNPIQLSLDDIVIGMKINQAGGKLEDNETLDDFLQKMAHIRLESLKEQGKKNLQRSEAFLANIAKKRGIVAVEDNYLYYEIKNEGSGSWQVEPDTMCEFHYTITTLDDETIIDTRRNDEAQCVDLAVALPGFSKGVIGMKKGERRVIYAHPDRAYGRLRQSVPPQMLVIIDVEAI